MGTYLNPGNAGFKSIIASDYVDKTGLIGLINESIGTKHKLTCVSRPRRFGKSFAAQMLCAYYDRNCDSHDLFEGLEISTESSYEKFINRFDVLYLDMTQIIGEAGNGSIVEFIKDHVIKEFMDAYPQIKCGDTLSELLLSAAEISNRKIVMIIDEWDAPIREMPDSEGEYLKLLRTLFKSSGTTDRIFAAVYMTGILPIKKDGTQSAVSDFYEYTMIKPREYGKYVGFTEEEVRLLCEKRGADFDKMKQWYDGYSFKGADSVYNPNSVMKAIRYEDYDSYWTETSAAEGLIEYISKSFHGIAKTVAELIGGIEVSVDTAGFANDLSTFRGRDDVLTLMIHLGYLAYDSEKKTVRIPNEEIKQEFQKAVRVVDNEETMRRLEESDRLFYDTIQGHEEAVAMQIEKVHMEETSPIHYNKEDSLRSVIKLAYYTYRDHYLQWEELPAGVGYADIVYLPKRDSDWPALVIELKWNKTAEGAIEQIIRNRYPEALKNYGGELILVGISYDKDTPVGERKHTCRIVKRPEV